MPLRTTTAKAIAQIERRDANGAAQYRAELKYFHAPQRAILGITNAYEVVDEAFTWGPASDYYQGTHRVPLIPGASAYEE